MISGLLGGTSNQYPEFKLLCVICGKRKTSEDILLCHDRTMKVMEVVRP